MIGRAIDDVITAAQREPLVESRYDAVGQYSLLIDKQPIVCADGHMMKCSMIENSYVPQQMIGLNDFLSSVKRTIDAYKTPDASPKITRRCYEDNASRGRATSFGDSSNSQSSISSPPQVRRMNSGTRSRSSSLKSPHSVLLKAATKPRDLDKNSVESTSSISDEERYLKEKYTAQIRGFCEADSDYVYMETLRSVTETCALLEAIIENKFPTVIDIEVNQDSSLTLCYQAINDFKQDFMMLKLDSDYCLFLAPF
ncbi:uncharacterized protein LOC135681541 isoform X2 [Rhopilema esculentum]|uniref:uncharacterized protein LOC135681541 isoform X2 n=1 Tax=Rhopilema esculentum TaxID=499914 RepID=UPI0031E30A1A